LKLFLQKYRFLRSISLIQILGLKKKLESLFIYQKICFYCWSKQSSHKFLLLISKIDKNSENLMKICPKTVLSRKIARIFSLKKPCYLENRVVREPCKQRTACISKCFLSSSQKILKCRKSFLHWNIIHFQVCKSMVNLFLQKQAHIGFQVFICF
jgi:hypothetical protein